MKARWIGVLLLGVMGGCGDDGSDVSDVSDASDAIDTSDAIVDTSVPDSDTQEPSETVSEVEDAVDTNDALDTGAPEVDTTDTWTGETDPYGFQIRIPEQRTVPNESFDGTITQTTRSDVDHVCKLVGPDLDTYLYVQATPVTCKDLGGCEYTTAGAWTSDGTKVIQVGGVAYDFGGNHHNDFITWDEPDRSFKVYHSSFGFGFRSCQPPDCLQIYDANGALSDDGCTSERTLPAICVLIGDDGREPALVDSFAKCNGDPNR